MPSIIGPIWTKRAKLEGRLDPLGLDRPSDRLTGELIPGVTVNVNLARYFSFLPWLFSILQDKNKDVQFQEIVRAEKSYALSALLAHEGETCANGIAGRDLIGDAWDVKQQSNLDRLKWFVNGGIYVNLYKGPLFKLGLLKTDRAHNTTVTEIGRPLAEAFARSVKGTVLSTKGFSRATLSRSELEEFGKRACPCSLEAQPVERAALRRLFFETQTTEGKMLGNTLGLILSVVKQCEPHTQWNLETQYRMALYYRQIFNDKDHPVSFKVLPKLESAWGEWRVFQAHDYFSFALETLLTLWLESLEAAPGQRLTLGQFLADIDLPPFFSALSESLGTQLSSHKLDTLKLSEIIQALPNQPPTGIVTGSSSLALDGKIRLGHRLAEQTLVDSILEKHQAHTHRVERCAEALLLLLITYTRFYHDHLQGQRDRGWWRYQAVSSQTETDLGLPSFYHWYSPTVLPIYSGRDWLVQLLSKHVIQQALDVRDERGGKAIWFVDAGLAGMGQLSPLTQAYQFQYSFDNYRSFRNTSKLTNALALLSDIGYVDFENGNYILTPDGQQRLQEQFGG